MLIAKGAEAEVHKEGMSIVKKRIRKSYRHPRLDDFLRKTRTRREARLLEKLSIPAPKLMRLDEKSYEITMTLIVGEKVRDVLDKDIGICEEIGENVALMHNQGIIHGDLTTSNMIYDKRLYLIDFGLSFYSDKFEDKAVDLHLLKQALYSKHCKVAKKAFSLVMKGYEHKSVTYQKIKQKLAVVEGRGRNKGKF
ncbi:MAG: Kae1-associated serine/threonine protein kinase [Candidatus Woesearchaeota archaeon]|nr:Kae1-associated serine/threonine protein kinase [Candidatus Woesearchaeota archaeon]